jgi:hypothetical protein
MVWASITPLLLTADFISWPADLAVITTRPPSAWITPPFLASAFTAPWSIVTLSKPSPAISSVMALPAARTTVPNRAEIKP